MNLKEALEYLRLDSNNRITLSNWTNMYIKCKLQDDKGEFGQYKVIDGCNPFLEESLTEHTLEIFGKDANWEVYPNMKTIEGKILKAQELNSDIIDYLKKKKIELVETKINEDNYTLTFLVDSLQDVVEDDFFESFIDINGYLCTKHPLGTAMYVKHFNWEGIEANLGSVVYSQEIENTYQVYSKAEEIYKELHEVFASKF